MHGEHIIVLLLAIAGWYQRMIWQLVVSVTVICWWHPIRKSWQGRMCSVWTGRVTADVSAPVGAGCTSKAVQVRGKGALQGRELALSGCRRWQLVSRNWGWVRRVRWRARVARP